MSRARAVGGADGSGGGGGADGAGGGGAVRGALDADPAAAGAREAVRRGALALLEEGLVAGTWGNVSVLGRPGLTAIPPSGSAYRAMRASDVVLVDLGTGESVGGKPSTERDLHAEIYRRRPEVKAIVHTHSMSASTVAAARREVPPILDDLAQIVGPSLRVADYALPGSGKMRKTVLAALRGRMAALMANHGAIALGRSLDEALVCARVLEKGCRAFIEAEFLGGAVALGKVEAFAMHQVYLRKYSRQAGGLGAATEGGAPGGAAADAAAAGRAAEAGDPAVPGGRP